MKDVYHEIDNIVRGSFFLEISIKNAIFVNAHGWIAEDLHVGAGVDRIGLVAVDFDQGDVHFQNVIQYVR